MKRETYFVKRNTRYEQRDTSPMNTIFGKMRSWFLVETTDVVAIERFSVKTKVTLVTTLLFCWHFSSFPLLNSTSSRCR